MRKNIFDFIRDKKNLNIDDDNNIVNDEKENQEDIDGDGCIDCGCNITKIPSSKSVEKKI